MKLEIRKKLRELVNLGFHDIYRYFNNDKREYTFWDYMASSWQITGGDIDNEVPARGDDAGLRIDRTFRSLNDRLSMIVFPVILHCLCAECGNASCLTYFPMLEKHHP